MGEFANFSCSYTPHLPMVNAQVLSGRRDILFWMRGGRMAKSDDTLFSVERWKGRMKSASVALRLAAWLAIVGIGWSQLLPVAVAADRRRP